MVAKLTYILELGELHLIISPRAFLEAPLTVAHFDSPCQRCREGMSRDTSSPRTGAKSQEQSAPCPSSRPSQTGLSSTLRLLHSWIWIIVEIPKNRARQPVNERNL